MTPTFGSLVPMLSLAPSTRLPHSSDHFVEFYDQDPQLIDSLTRFVSAGLVNDDSAIVVATADHRESLDRALLAGGVDVDAARERGVYMSFDAQDTLAIFMKDELPDPQEFENLFGGIMERAARGGRNVRVFGEMVALLWAQGNVPAVLRLEDLWNQLTESHPFRLFCAYPIELFGGRNLAPLRSVCQRHTHLVAASEASV